MSNLNVNSSPNGAGELPAPKGVLPKNGLTRKQKKLLFYISAIAYSIIQISIFYLYTHLNSIILAFKKYGIEGGKLVTSFAGFENFAEAFKILKENLYMVKNSLILYAFNLGVGFTLALVFSFYIYKKYKGAKIFQVILFMPNLISGLVFALIFRYLVTDVYRVVFSVKLGLLDNESTKFATVLFYNIWVSFGVNVMMFSGSMSGIDDSLVEAAQLDGVSIVQEFFHLTIPMIFSTFKSFIIIGMVGIFTHQMSLFSLFGNNGYDVGTLGYYLYVEASQSGTTVNNPSTPTYSVLSALGVILTFVLVPIVIGTKKLLEKYGPSVE